MVFVEEGGNAKTTAGLWGVNGVIGRIRREGETGPNCSTQNSVHSLGPFYVQARRAEEEMVTGSDVAFVSFQFHPACEFGGEET